MFSLEFITLFNVFFTSTFMLSKTGSSINQVGKFRSSCKRLTFRTCSEAEFHSRLL